VNILDASLVRPATNYPQLPEGWRWVRLGEVCEINPRRPDLDRKDDSLNTFVPMSAVDQRLGTIVRAETKPFGQVRKGYTYFEDGDVLFAKITPCMQNGKHAIAHDLIGGFGFGTTEFHVLRPSPAIIPDWIHLFIRQPQLLENAKAYFTGAVGQQRVPESYLADLEIPLPPVEEQKRIAAILNEQMAAVERARAAAEAQLEAAKALPAAYLRAVFSGPETQKWPVKKLGEILNLRKEIVHPREDPSGPATFVGLEHVESITGKRIGSLPVEMSQLTGRKPRFYKGDVVYGYLRPYLNKVWVAEFDGLCSVDQYVYSVTASLADTEYVAWFMRSDLFLKRAPVGDAPAWLPRIRTDEVSATPINLPSLEEQRRIAAIIKDQIGSAERARRAIEKELATINKLPAAFVHWAFSGAL